MNIRVGFGYDVHQLTDGDTLYLGGKAIPSALKSVAHSDGDVLIHALCDALLGAANLGDIGTHFPDTDIKYKGIDSKKLLKNVMDLLHNEGFEFGNADCTVVLEIPKLKPHIADMQTILAEVMNCSISQISIKATTSEKMGFVGHQQGIAAYATVLIKSKE